MKKLLAIILVLSSISTMAQTTAMDFTKTDCDGNNYNLYTELNGGKVVIIEFVMLDCTPCIIASNGLKSILADYATSNPGKVEAVAIGYINSYTCQELNTWKTTNNFNARMFTEGADQVSYYGGMGMPTIAIAAGGNHKILYLKQGYAPSDNQNMRNAINQALVIAGSNTPQQLTFSMYPNPASNAITVELPMAGNVTISDIAGKAVWSNNYPDAGSHTLFPGLASGIYMVQVQTATGSATQKLVIR